MDGFTDRLSQHFSTPQDVINANGQAEATESARLQAEVRGLIDTLEVKLGELKASDESAAEREEYSAQISGVEDKLENHIHKENVRVYRNVQAAVTDELAKQTEQLKSEFSEITDRMEENFASKNDIIIGELSQQTELLSAMMETLNEQQKGQGEAISGMAVKMNHMESEVKSAVKNRALLAIQIIMLILVLGDLAMNVLITLGFL